MDVPERYGADPRASLEKMRPRIRKKLEESELSTALSFNSPSRFSCERQGTEEYTDPVFRFRHKQGSHFPTQWD